MACKNTGWLRRLGSSLLTLLFLAFFFWQMGGSSCWFYTVLGLPCPGCGMTRALLAASRGLWRQAFNFHPLFWTLPLLAGLLLAGFLRQNQRKTQSGLRRAGFFLAAAFLVVYLIRMVWFFPHSGPMRYNQNALLPRLFRLLQGLF